MDQLLAGGIAMGSMIIALFFLRFWRDTRDRFFLYFALSFAIEGGHRVYTSLSTVAHEDAPLHYLIRLLAYSLILWAIAEKNWPRRSARE